ncbi:MAG: tetraacyldisaccharide 4'-kinase [Proteobacteria bacterium]|nr:MAG: tetraacyldisaccharide 4'-kinase [Pseudomonadota bacterium]
MSLIQQFWYRVRPSHVVLYPLSLLFAAAAWARRALYRAGWRRAQRLPVPVIVVGNITVGGTGKTPLVLWLCDFLRQRQYRPGIVSRGYGGSERLQQVFANSDPLVAGDETVILARRSGLPVFVARDRVAAAHALLRAHPECTVIVSDDGLQHYRLQRDIEIAVVDGNRGFGTGWLLPAGPLREPLARLESVDAVVVNGGDPASTSDRNRIRMRLQGKEFHNLIDSARRALASEFQQQPVHAIAGIGYPNRFFETLRSLGLTFRAHAFPDHFRYRPQDLAFVGDQVLLMTEKDAVKCAAFARENWWFLPVEVELDPALGQLVLAKLSSVLHGRKTA